jgi:L-asparagine transporter-like permease
MEPKSYNVIPLGGYSLKLFGLVLLCAGGALKVLSYKNQILFKDMGFFANWFIIAGLSFVNFSREKNENNKTTLMRFFAFKNAGIFVSGFILAINLVAYMFKTNIGLTSMMIAFLFNLVFAISYFAFRIFTKAETDEQDTNDIYKEGRVMRNN